MTRLDLPSGGIAFDPAGPDAGAQLAVFDLVWKDGLQPGLTGPVAVLLNEPAEMLSPASAAGLRYFTVAAEFRRHVEIEILNLEAA